MGLLASFPLVAILGPTAVGKTDLSIRLAQEIRAEIVSFDSVQVYRGLDIGSAKPSRQEMDLVPHHMIDIVDPQEVLDAATYASRAWARIKAIRRRGNNVVLVGGTGLYLKALLQGLARIPSGDPFLRERLRAIARKRGKMALYRMLGQVDPEALSRIHPEDLFRIIRALEVYIYTARPISYWQRLHRQVQRNQPCCIKIGLCRPRDELYQRIEKRVDQMMQQGFLEEVKGLLEMGLDPRLRPLKSLGYRHIVDYLLGRYELSEAMRLLKRDTRRYAKRQITWFRADPLVRWFHPDHLRRARSIWLSVMGGRDN